MDPSYNNSFDTAKTKKKPFLYIGIGFLIIIAIIVVTILVINLNKQNSKEELFTNYSNLLIYGKADPAEAPGEISLSNIMTDGLNNIYSVPRNYSLGDEGTVKYYNELISSLDKLIETINNSNVYDDEYKDSLVGLIKESKELVTCYFVGSILVYGNAPFNYYMENEKLDGLLSVFNYPFEDDIDEDIEAYTGRIDALYDSLEKYFNEIASINCIADGLVDYACVENANSSVIKNEEKTISEMKNVLSDRLEDWLMYIVDDANNIKTMMKGEENA